MKEHYECTIQPRVGPGAKDAKGAVVLTRIVRWAPAGIEYEADPRHAEKLIAECGLTGANTVATPGLRMSKEEAQNDQPLEQRLHTAFRGSAARANYLAADRIDCQFAAKEICRCRLQLRTPGTRSRGSAGTWSVFPGWYTGTSSSPWMSWRSSQTRIGRGALAPAKVPAEDVLCLASTPSRAGHRHRRRLP